MINLASLPSPVSTQRIRTHTHIVWGSGSHRGNERQEEAQIWVDGEIPQVISHSHTHATHSLAQRNQMEGNDWEELSGYLVCLIKYILGMGFKELVWRISKN